MNGIPHKPHGTGAAAYFFQLVWEMLFNGKLPFRSVKSADGEVSVNWVKGAYEVKVSGGRGGGGVAWHFGTKIEVDNTQTYPSQTVIHIQSTDALVTTGIRDAANPTGGLVTSCAGFWVSTQTVPAKTQVDGNDVWNLPQYPYPEPTDMDDPTNFWIYLGEVVSC